MVFDSNYTAERYANALLRDVGLSARAHCEATHPAIRNAQSGLNELTGRADGLAQLCPVPLASCADGVIAALRAIGEHSVLKAIDGAALLGERAACCGYTRAGSISSGGSCRLLRAADGWFALNLARDSDWDLFQLLPHRRSGARIGHRSLRHFAIYLSMHWWQRGRLLGPRGVRDDAIGCHRSGRGCVSISLPRSWSLVLTQFAIPLAKIRVHL